MLLDEAEIEVQGGDGGNGMVSFRREKFVPRGGPNGGTGGNGGSVVLQVDAGTSTLSHFQHKRHFVAGRGGHGGPSNRQGARGSDVIVPVPPGTIARDLDSGEILADMVVAGQELVVARGGSGGRGNTAFKGPTNQAPRFAEKGEPGEARRLGLELKLLADVGLLGMPNAGKSTFLSRITSARPKVADYPFTTLEPNLGVVEVGYTAIVVADIPGLIEGASEGAGLGHKFLRHVERTRLLVHLLDGAGDDPVGALRTLNAELAAFSQRLAERPQIVVINKIDLPDTVAALPRLRNALRRGGAARVLTMSALTGSGTRQVVDAITAALATLPEEEPDAGELPVLRPLEDDDAFTVYRVVGEEACRIKGRRLERAAAMTDFSNDEAVDRFHRILEAMGVTERLRALGIADGQTVRIGDTEFEWAD